MRHGFAFRGEYFSDHGRFIVLTPGNFYDEGGFKPKSGIEKFYSAEPPDDYVLHRDDLVVAMTEQVQGLLGSSALIPEDGVYLHNQRIGLVELACDVDRRFVYYLFNTPHVRNQIQATATGSKIRHTAPGRIEAVEAAFPPLPIQRKIAAILCAYDDLIENNDRRIKILEETARRIYREWFVHFRYPGHETVPLRASAFGPIPDGWNVGSLGEVVDVNARTARSLEAFESVEYIDISSVETGRVQARRKLLPAEAPGRARRLLQDGDTIWSTVRPNLRAYALIAKPASSWLASTGFAVLSPRLVPMSFLYALATDERFVSYLVNHATGSAYPAVTGSVFEKAPIVQPPAALLARYAEIGDPTLRLAAELRTTNSVLASARDLLLPGLISGEIDVRDLDIEVPEGAA